jgi:hypothetical protein
MSIPVSQIYETELWWREAQTGVRLVVVPARSLETATILNNPWDVLAELQLEQLSDPISASTLPLAVASVLKEADNPPAAAQHFNLARAHLEAFATDHSGLLEFAEYVSYADVVPFESSPLSPDSLGKILTAGSGAGIGAGVALMVAGGPTPLLFVTVPAGMIVCGAAMGVSEALQKGLRYKILKLMGVPTEQPTA